MESQQHNENSEQMPLTCAACGAGIDAEAVYCPFCDEPVAQVSECCDYEYEAFVSYRHLPHDVEVAKQVQRRLEGFRIPNDPQAGGLADRIVAGLGVAGHVAADSGVSAAGVVPTSHGIAGRPKRLGRLFRDEDELPTASSLSAQIRDALKRSRFLIVVCTPATRESRWVAQEVELFATFHGRDRVLVVLAEAEPADSFPELLMRKTVVDADGTVGIAFVEPLAADFRDPKRYAAESVRIAAALIGCGYDDLRQRMKTRRARLMVGIAAGIAAVSVVFGGFSVYQQAQVTENYRHVQINESQLLADKANKLYEQGDRYEAVKTALSALPDKAAGVDRPYVPAAQAALENALEIHPPSLDWIPCYSQTDVDIWNSCINDDYGLMATIARDRAIEVREVLTGRLVSRADVSDFAGVRMARNDAAAMTFAGDKLLFLFHETVGCFDARTGAECWKRTVKNAIVANYHQIAVSPDGTSIAVVTEDLDSESFGYEVLKVADGTTLQAGKLPDSSRVPVGTTMLGFSASGDMVAVAHGSQLWRINLKSGKVNQRGLGKDHALSLRYVGNLLTVVSSESPYDAKGKTTLEVFDGKLDLVWEHTGEVPMMVDAAMHEYNYLVGACGIWSYEKGSASDAGADGDDAQLVVAFGTDLLLLDKKTGKEVYRKHFESPILGCSVLRGSSGKSFIVLATGEGDILYRMPQRGEDEVNLSLVLDRNVGSLFRADVFECDGRFCASVWKFEQNKHVMYRLADTDDYPNFKRVEELDDLFLFSESRLVAKSDRSVTLYSFEHDSAQRMWSIALDQFSDFKHPELAEITVGDADIGKCYIGGTKKDDPDNASVAALIYVLDEPSGSIEKKLIIDHFYSTVDSLDEVYDAQSGQTLLLVQGAGDVAIVDVDSGELLCHGSRYMTAGLGEPIIAYDDHNAKMSAGLLLEGLIEQAWIVGDNLVIAQDVSIEQSSHYEVHFVLFNWKTGEFLDTELSRYVAAYPGVSNLSNDCSLLATVSRDGEICLFSTVDGAMKWSSMAVDDDVTCIAVVGAGDVFYQEASGSYGLLSGQTGQPECMSSDALPKLRNASMYNSRDNTLLVFKSAWDAYLNTGGIALISLDEESFGPKTIIDEGVTISADGTAALLKCSLTEMQTSRLFTLEELEAQAHELLGE